MLTVKIKENTKQGKALAEYVKTLPFVEILEDETETELLKQIEQGLKDVKRIKEGQLPQRTVKQMINDK